MHCKLIWENEQIFHMNKWKILNSYQNYLANIDFRTCSISWRCTIYFSLLIIFGDSCWTDGISQGNEAVIFTSFNRKKLNNAYET